MGLYSKVENSKFLKEPKNITDGKYSCSELGSILQIKIICAKVVDLAISSHFAVVVSTERNNSITHQTKYYKRLQ